MRGNPNSTSTSTRPPNPQALDTTESGPDYHIGGRVYNISDIAPGRRIFQSKQHLPNCTACRGCDHTLVRGAGLGRAVGEGAVGRR
jgi:hypothetical protein